MSPDIYVESQNIGYAILWGVELAVFYDAISIFRNVIRHKNIFIYIEDFFYWMFCALFVFEHLYEIGDGHIRWYMALGVGIGMLSYKLTLNKWVVKGISFVLQKILWIIGKIFSLVFKPLRFLARKIRKFFRFIKARIASGFRLIKKKLTLAIKMLKITLCKRKR